MPVMLIVKAEQDSERGFFEQGESCQEGHGAVAQKWAATRRPGDRAMTGLVAAILIGFAAPANVHGQGEKTVTKVDAGTPKPVKSGHIEANGINYYYELYGKGETLLLLHGGLGSIDTFRPVLPILTQKRLVIVVDLQGHWRTLLGDREINLGEMGDDMAVIVKTLGFQQTDALGDSLGGGVAFRFAVTAPRDGARACPRLHPFAQNGLYPEILPMQAQISATMAEQMKQTPMYESYIKVAPNPADFQSCSTEWVSTCASRMTSRAMSRSSLCQSCWSMETVT